MKRTLNKIVKLLKSKGLKARIKSVEETCIFIKSANFDSSIDIDSKWFLSSDCEYTISVEYYEQDFEAINILNKLKQQIYFLLDKNIKTTILLRDMPIQSYESDEWLNALRANADYHSLYKALIETSKIINNKLEKTQIRILPSFNSEDKNHFFIYLELKGNSKAIMTNRAFRLRFNNNLPDVLFKIRSIDEKLWEQIELKFKKIVREQFNKYVLRIIFF